MIPLHRIYKVLRRNSLQAIPTVFCIAILSFLLLQMAPGDAVDVIAAESGAATQESMAALRNQLNLDLPVMQRLGKYLIGISHFDFGHSTRFGVSVGSLILERLPQTIFLAATALAVALALGIALGALMATFKGRLLDRILSGITLLLYSIPNFWIGLMLIVAFSVHLDWLPSGGANSIGAELHGWAWAADRLTYMALPALSLSLLYVAVYARLMRASMIEARSQEYVRTAEAKGVPPFFVILRHVIRNALLPVTTMAGIHVGGMLGGAIVVETVYAWPGLGRLAYEAVLGRDFNVLMGILLLSSLLVIVTNMAVDLLHAVLDPRVEAR